jgi:hypothetical protein
MPKAQVTATAHPDFEVHGKLAPVGFDIGSEGSFSIAMGPIRARCEALPITLRIPFLRRRQGRVVAALLGPSGLQVGPFEAHVNASGVSITGTVGTEDGLHADLMGGGSCKMEVDAKGNFPVRMAKAAVEGMADD